MKEEYLLAKIQRVLAEDGSELGIDAIHRGDEYVLIGEVESEQRRLMAARLVNEHVPEARVRNDIRVAKVTKPVEVEELEPRISSGGEQ
jgi:hypothetical protein